MDNSNQEIPQQQEETHIFTEQDFSLDGYDKNIRRARNWLFAVVGLQFLWAIIMYAASTEGDIMIGGMEVSAKAIEAGIQIFIGLLFLGLALWSKKKPVLAFTIALCLYIGFYILFGILNPINFVSGIIIKIFLVIALIKGLKDAKEAEDMKNLVR
jgi:hypothetical protein